MRTISGKLASDLLILLTCQSETVNETFLPAHILTLYFLLHSLFHMEVWVGTLKASHKPLPIFETLWPCQLLSSSWLGLFQPISIVSNMWWHIGGLQYQISMQLQGKRELLVIYLCLECFGSAVYISLLSAITSITWKDPTLPSWFGIEPRVWGWGLWEKKKKKKDNDVGMDEREFPCGLVSVTSYSPVPPVCPMVCPHPPLQQTSMLL